MKTDIEISQDVDLLPINKVAKSIGLTENDDGKLILVTSINPTPTGEGKWM